MPQISDDALLALDNMFEMARYSRDEMGAQHQQAAQLALEKMIQRFLHFKRYLIDDFTILRYKPVIVKVGLKVEIGWVRSRY